MRFYEFEVGQPIVIDYRTMYQQQMINEGYLQRQTIHEATVDERYINEYREFISNYIQDPSKLINGQEYYVLFLFARPLAKTIKLEYSPNKITFSGVQQDKFIFNLKDKIFQLPIYDDIDEQTYAPYFMSTNLYLDKDDINQMVTLIATKFGGSWKLEQKIFK